MSLISDERVEELLQMEKKMNENLTLGPGPIDFYKPEYWGLIELMGHGRIVGRIHQADIGDGKLLQVDVLDKSGEVAYTRILSPTAIYAMNPTSQEVAIQLAKERTSPSPVLSFSFDQIRAELRKELQREIDESNQIIYPPTPEEEDEAF
jgi:hypothetical protein